MNMSEEIKVTPSTGNVFADLESPNADALIEEARASIETLRKYLQKLITEDQSEKATYKIANEIAKELFEEPNIYHQHLVAIYLEYMPIRNRCIVLATLNDTEFITTNPKLLRTANAYVKSTDKRLAQTAASFLLSTNAKGVEILDNIIATEHTPHLNLIQSIKQIWL